MAKVTINGKTTEVEKEEGQIGPDEKIVGSEKPENEFTGITLENEDDENEKLKNTILNRAKETENELASLSEEDAKLEMDDAFTSRGIDEDTRKKVMGEIDRQFIAAGGNEGEVNLEVSPIFTTLGWLPVEQDMIENDIEFSFLSTLMPIRKVKNGKKLVFYSDNYDTDETPGYKVPATAQEYYGTFINEKVAITTEEEWKTNINLHKGILYPSIALNDFTSREAIFLALFDNYTKQIATPMARALYRLRLTILQDTLNMTNKDWSKMEIDHEITGTTVAEGWEKLKNLLASLTQPSRQNQPDRYKPLGFTKPLETRYNPENTTLIIPVALENYLKVQVRAGLFNEKYMDITPEIVSNDYQKSFVEYTGATNVKDQPQDAILFLVPKGAVEIIEHYKTTRGQPLLVLFTVEHLFLRVGRVINKKNPILNISFKITEPESKKA